MLLLPPSRAGLLLALSLSSAVPVLLSGCSQAEQHEAATDTRATFNDFRAYVESAERDVARTDLSDTEFSAETRRAQANYATRRAAAQSAAADWTAEQRADFDALQTRFAAAVEQRRAAFRARAARAETAVSDTTRRRAYQTGEAIGRGARKAGKVIDKGAQKVGAAAKEVFKGVRDGVKAEDEPNVRK